ncbi:MAG TPA: FHA domain-containing protein [Kofleriaceae bacterium]|nr:FHA domain-containing protein [Kofleriaceae bacterium]
MRCAVCRERPAAADLLCGPCVDDLARPFRFTRDRVRTVSVPPSSTVLIDPWGRAHPIDTRTLLGRTVERGIEIVEASVSRHHAEIVRAQTWVIHDLGSRNGTFVNDVRVTEPMPLVAGARLRIGQVGFYFVDLPMIISVPQRFPGRRARHSPSTMPEDPSVFVPADTGDEGEPDDDDAFAENAPVTSTRIGLPAIAIDLFSSTPSTPAAIEVDGKRTNLTLPQYELMSILCTRALAEASGPEATRGFVSSLELTQRITFDTPDRIDSHLKQLVLRTRRLLDRAGIGDLIESRQGFGYRLRVTPKA